jgi:hypothetical protein
VIDKPKKIKDMKNKKVLMDAQKVYNVSCQCIAHLQKTQNMTFNQAESVVLKTLEDSRSYLESGMVDFVIASLRMIFLNDSVETAANRIIKK